MLRMIVCMGENREIGYQNDMPWGRGLPADLAYFKEKTWGGKVLMGRKTYDSILTSLGHRLPGRKHAVLTTNKQFQTEEVEVLHCISDVNASEEDIWVIGGASIYTSLIEQAEEIYVTCIHQGFVADTYFPILEKEAWKEVSRIPGVMDAKNPYPHDFVVYKKK